MSWANLGFGTGKNIAPFWVITPARHLLSEIDLRNHDPSVFNDKWGKEMNL